MGGKQLRHIKYVLAGIERDRRGEQWVREQFRQFTEAALAGLERLGADRLQDGRPYRMRMLTLAPLSPHSTPIPLALPLVLPLALTLALTL